MLQFQVVNKYSIHINMDGLGALKFIDKLAVFCSETEVDFDLSKEELSYGGKRFAKVKIKKMEGDEYYYFNNQTLFLEIDPEMITELILFFTKAIKEKGFQTPEIISFSPKNKKERTLTLYGFLKE